MRNGRVAGNLGAICELCRCGRGRGAVVSGEERERKKVVSWGRREERGKRARQRRQSKLVEEEREASRIGDGKGVCGVRRGACVHVPLLWMPPRKRGRDRV